MKPKKNRRRKRETFKVKVNHCYLGATKANVRRFWVHHFHPARASNLPQTLPNQSFPRNHWLPWGNCFHNHWKPKVWLKIVPIKLWTVLQNNKSQILTLPHRHKMSGETPFLKKYYLWTFDSLYLTQLSAIKWIHVEQIIKHHHFLDYHIIITQLLPTKTSAGWTRFFTWRHPFLRSP